MEFEITRNPKCAGHKKLFEITGCSPKEAYLAHLPMQFFFPFPLYYLGVGFFFASIVLKVPSNIFRSTSFMTRFPHLQILHCSHQLSQLPFPQNIGGLCSSSTAQKCIMTFSLDTLYVVVVCMIKKCPRTTPTHYGGRHLQKKKKSTKLKCPQLGLLITKIQGRYLVSEKHFKRRQRQQLAIENVHHCNTRKLLLLFAQGLCKRDPTAPATTSTNCSSLAKTFLSQKSKQHLLSSLRAMLHRGYQHLSWCKSMLNLDWRSRSLLNTAKSTVPSYVTSLCPFYSKRCVNILLR